MKTILITTLLFIAVNINAFAQQPVKLYDPKADAHQEIKNAVEQAKKEHKHVLLQVGGNWCSWCTRFNNFVTTNDTLKNLMDKNYISLHVNFSPENKNETVLANLAFPQRFGFPVFVILDENGNRIHTQNSAYLEEAKGYSLPKVAEFFGQWSAKAIDPATYQK